MFKSFAILPLVTSIALAQGTSSPIPSGISSKCSTFLDNLNTHPTLNTCTSSLITATSAYASGSNASKPSSGDVTTAFSNLCSPAVENACTSDLIGGQITAFYSACSAELTSNLNTDVLDLYDVLYAIKPLRDALCSLDDGGNFCAKQTKLPPSTNSASLQKVLSLPSSNGTSLVPNTTTFRITNLPFLFLQPSPSSASVCSVCTRKIMNSYLSFEAGIPYAPGLGKSTLLSSQVELYTSISNTCGSNFLSEAGVVKAAGGLSGGTLSSGAAPTIGGVTQGSVAVGMAILALVISSVF